ncbi:MAG: polyprenyl synthetase family protein [Acidobacteria bacterium]|nr:polyprenyl synthetase family protein [Acidobacteriota bacterium]
MSPSASAPPTALTVVAGPVEDRVRSLLDEEIRHWSAIDADLTEPLQALAEFILGGGKRLRPAFCHWAFIGAGGPPEDAAVIDAGAALELLHAFALIHDDVMDGSDTRRRAATIHTRFAAAHQEGSWNGEARRFGEGVAILIGDLAEVFADRLMVGAPSTAFEAWSQLKIEVNIGQYLDVLGAARGGTDLATSRRIAHYKSGKYTIERPLHIGAALVDRLQEFREQLSAYGSPLGEAFQLRDDILGAFGDEARTGKPVGDDLREGKPTPLLAIARAEASAQQRPLLDRVGAVDLSVDEISAIQQLLIDTGARQHIEDDIAALTTSAIEALDGIAFDHAAIAALRDLAHYVSDRDL